MRRALVTAVQCSDTCLLIQRYLLCNRR